MKPNAECFDMIPKNSKQFKGRYQIRKLRIMNNALCHGNSTSKLKQCDDTKTRS